MTTIPVESELLEQLYEHLATKGRPYRAKLRAKLRRTLLAEQPQAGAGRDDVRSASEWFALVMNAAAELEDAANCLRDAEAKKKAMGAASYYRAQANSAHQPPALHDRGDEVLRDAKRYRWIAENADVDCRGHAPDGDYASLGERIDAALTQSPKGEEE